MKLKQPIAINKRDKPVIIFKNGEELKEFPSIKVAAEWLKLYLNHKNIPFDPIMDGILSGLEWEQNKMGIRTLLRQMKMFV